MRYSLVQHLWKGTVRSLLWYRNLAANIKKHKATILISSHDLNHVTEVCERIAILEKGVIIHDLKTDESTLEKLQTYFAV